MCLILFSKDTHPAFPLIIAANRDEFYARPTEPAHRWENPVGLIAGRDLAGGGTWLGMHPEKGVAMLTNYRDPGNVNPEAPSRGELVTGYFREAGGPQDYLKSLVDAASNYNGFNLVCAGRDGMYYFSNYGNEVRKVERGIHGLSNGLLNEAWPKVVNGREKMAVLHRRGESDPLKYLELLYDDIIADDSQLPSTGVSREMERMLSPMFIKSPAYGSRSSTVILIDNQGNVQFTERTYTPGTNKFKDREFRFAWKAD